MPNQQGQGTSISKLPLPLEHGRAEEMSPSHHHSMPQLPLPAKHGRAKEMSLIVNVVMKEPSL
jgi:hypothetical protein